MGRRRKKDQTTEYDPNFTVTGTPRKIYRAPSKKQKTLREENRRLAEQGMATKRHLVPEKHAAKKKGEKEYICSFTLRLTALQREYVQQKAFRAGIPAAEWIRRVIDALRMAEVGALVPEETKDGGKE